MFFAASIATNQVVRSNKLHIFSCSSFSTPEEFMSILKSQQLHILTALFALRILISCCKVVGNIYSYKTIF